MSALPKILHELRVAQSRFQKRDEKGRFSKQGRAITVPTKPHPKAKPEGGQRVVHDKHIGRDVTTANDGIPISHPVVKGLHGENIEKAMHTLIEGGATTGFAVAKTGSRHSLAHRLMTAADSIGLTYAYYARGQAAKNGRPNQEHVRGLQQMLEKEMPGKVRVQTVKQTGHVKNGGWDSEDHMETVHYKDRRRANGVERSAQHLLAIAPHEDITDPAEKRKVIKEASKRVRDHAEKTGFLWDVPDAKIYGAEPPDKKNWTKMPLLTVDAPTGVYSVLHSPVGSKEGQTSPEAQEKLRKTLKATSRSVWMPKEWESFIEPLNDTAISKAEKELKE